MPLQAQNSGWPTPNSTLERVGGQHHALAALILGNTWYPLYSSDSIYRLRYPGRLSSVLTNMYSLIGQECITAVPLQLLLLLLMMKTNMYVFYGLLYNRFSILCRWYDDMTINLKKIGRRRNLISTFAWREWENTRETSVSIADVLTNTRTGHLRRANLECFHYNSLFGD